MLFNQMKNYKGFTAIKELWLTTLLLSMFMLSFSVNAANDDASINNNELIIKIVIRNNIESFIKLDLRVIFLR